MSSASETFQEVREADSQFIVAVGFPCGLYEDEQSKKGLIRLEGSLVEVEAREYLLWLALLSPLRLIALPRLSGLAGLQEAEVGESLSHLRRSALVAIVGVSLEGGSDLDRLRPLPLFLNRGDPGGLGGSCLQSPWGDATEPMALDPFMTMAVWHMDGATSVLDIREELLQRCPGVKPEEVSASLALAVIRLMQQRMLYLDRAIRSRGEP